MWQAAERSAGGKQLSTALDKILFPSFLPPSFPPPSFPLPSIYNLAHPWLPDSPKGRTWWAASAGQVGPPTGPLLDFPEPLLSWGAAFRPGREEPLCRPCSLASRLPMRYTQSWLTLPFPQTLPPSTRPEVLPQPGTESWAPAVSSTFQLAHLPLQPRALPTACPPVTSEQTSVCCRGWGGLDKH